MEWSQAVLFDVVICLFDIGGKNKTDEKIEGVENAYIAADDIGYIFGNKIILWLFSSFYTDYRSLLTVLLMFL